ncbi:hypothetical protein [Lacisediminimonas profundi]|uniref:hypothetical protein n=1 Tax=Lacisediminimonas profundi TaxID=2603856 RepID=UPI00124B917F|nr:hypothetical protein [Lacisediminimonas profundi]
MQQTIMIGTAHWVYLAGVAVIVLTMILRANVVVPSIIGTFAVMWALTGSPVSAVAGVFNASFVAAKELFNIFLVIAFMTALLNALRSIGSDIRMVEPFRGVMKNGHVAYFVLAAITYVISLFFWPTPAVPLVAAILLPAAIAAGLPPLMGAMAIAIAGQGMALSSDYVIGVAPGISAKAAGAAVQASMVADRALVLSVIVGGIALILGYFSMRRYIVAANPLLLARWQSNVSDNGLSELKKYTGSYNKEMLVESAASHQVLGTDSQVSAALAGSGIPGWSKIFAIVTPLTFLGVVLVMVLPKLGMGTADLKGGDAAALVGGVAAILMMAVTWAAVGPRKLLDVAPDHIVDGLVFAFKAMGAVLPIAGFFFVGANETLAQMLGVAAAKAPNLLFEVVQASQHMIPDSRILVAFGVLIVGMITGIDGSGFAGLPLTGSLSGALGPVSGIHPATLAAIGQMGAVWTGGGCLIAWSSLIAVAGFSRVPVLDAVRMLMVPVLTGLAAATIAAVVLW